MLNNLIENGFERSGMIRGKLKGLGLATESLTAFSQFIWASDSIRARLFTFLGRHDMTASQFGVLDALYHLGSHTQRDLGSHILKSGGNITMVVDNLEKSGLVRRERSQKDRRMVNVHITEQGRKRFRRILPRVLHFIEDEMSGLSQRELRELGRLCVRIGSNKGRSTG
jgi:MarR family 2-MHQ and catechol resistance regulon transcriptional repressor